MALLHPAYAQLQKQYMVCPASRDGGSTGGLERFFSAKRVGDPWREVGSELPADAELETHPTATHEGVCSLGDGLDGVAGPCTSE